MELDRRVAVVVPAETFWIGGVRGEREREREVWKWEEDERESEKE